MSKNITELCTLLVEREHGELAADVFATCAHVGRQHLVGLIRASNLSAKHFKHGLATLLQHQLVLQSEADEVAFYEPSWEYAHNLARTGKVTRLVELRYGNEAGEIILTLLNSGHAKVSDMAAAYRVIHAKADDAKNSKGPALSNRAHSKKVISNGETFTGGNKISTNGYNGDRSSTKRKASVDVEIGSDVGAGNRGEVGTAESNGINGSAKVQVSDKPDTHVKSDVHMHSILYRLLKAGWIVPVAKRDFWSTSDQRLDAEVHVLEHHYEKGKVPKGPKQMKALQGLIKQRMHQLREQTLDFSESSSIQTGSKRPSAYTELPPSKRAKTNGVNGSSHFTSSAEDENILLDGELIVRVNPEKVNVAMRTEQLVRLAHRFIGETTSKVYRAFLQVLEEQTPRCYDVLKADPEADANSNNTLIIDSKASVLKIAEVIDPSVDLHDGLAESTDGINGNSGDSLVNRGHLVEKHMKILSEDPRQFASWASSRGISEWYVEFPRLSRYLIQNQIEETVQSRFERLGMRLLRLLHSKGKLDEKQVANGSMSLPKLIRPALSQMQAAGFLDLQEIPKDNSRHPSRTIFLWFYDQDRVRRLLLEDACKAMARILQRIEVEREELREVLDKAERTDIKGNEDKYLSKIERQKLRQWAQIEAKLSIQLERVDELVGILRDFLGPIP